MNFKKAAGQISAYFICVLIMWFVIRSLIDSEMVISGVYSGVMRCLNVMIPSLFGMMLVSEIIISSGIYQKISGILYPLAKWVFNMPAPLFFVFIMGNAAGYPVGAKLLSQLHTEGAIDKKTAEVMSAFCFGSGPAFVFGTVGIGIFSSLTVGVYVFISCLLANTIAALIAARICKFKIHSENKQTAYSPELFVKSVEASGRAMLMICLMIITFSYALSVLDGAGVFEIFKSSQAAGLVKAFLEISNISELKSNIGLLPVITSLISFGGICVQIQIVALVRGNFGLKRFFFYRIIISVLAGIINFSMICIFPVSKYCTTEIKYSQIDKKSSVLSAICLIFMIIIIFFQKKTSNPKKSVI